MTNSAKKCGIIGLNVNTPYIFLTGIAISAGNDSTLSKKMEIQVHKTQIKLFVGDITEQATDATLKTFINAGQKEA
jgi:hypothetical protein